MTSLVGQTIGGCRIEKLLGKGGMGSVYKAHHINLNIPVAIKILSQHLANSQELVERFLIEARSAARLNSPHIVRVLQVGQEQDCHFLQMEYVDGESLAKILKTRVPLDFPTAAHYLYQIALGLAAAHDENIIHRDIKPDNIMVNNKGICKIADFGLAKSLQASAVLTQPGQLLGTPYYLSPEQCEGKESDARSDIYALGITFYYMLTAQLPFTGDNTWVILMARTQRDPLTPREVRAEIPEVLETITLKMMARDPQQRYLNARDLLGDLSPLLSEFPLASSQSLIPEIDTGYIPIVAGEQTMATAPTIHSAPSMDSNLSPQATMCDNSQRETMAMEVSQAAAPVAPSTLGATRQNLSPGEAVDTMYRVQPATASKKPLSTIVAVVVVMALAAGGFFWHSHVRAEEKRLVAEQERLELIEQRRIEEQKRLLEEQKQIIAEQKRIAEQERIRAEEERIRVERERLRLVAEQKRQAEQEQKRFLPGNPPWDQRYRGKKRGKEGKGPRDRRHPEKRHKRNFHEQRPVKHRSNDREKQELIATALDTIEFINGLNSHAEIAQSEPEIQQRLNKSIMTLAVKGHLEEARKLISKIKSKPKLGKLFQNMAKGSLCVRLRQRLGLQVDIVALIQKKQYEEAQHHLRMMRANKIFAEFLDDLDKIEEKIAKKMRQSGD